MALFGRWGMGLIRIHQDFHLTNCPEKICPRAPQSILPINYRFKYIITDNMFPNVYVYIFSERGREHGVTDNVFPNGI